MSLAQEDRVSDKPFSALIVEDDPVCATILASLITEIGGKCIISTSLEDARQTVNKHTFDVFLLDHFLPDGKGSDFYYELRNLNKTIPAIMITAAPDLLTAVELTRDGLFDYFTKPYDTAKVKNTIKRAVHHATPSSFDWGSVGLVGRSPVMTKIAQLISKAAANPEATILLTGETGTGKDMCARLVHELTFHEKNSAAPYISLNCPTLPSEMFEAELFGAEKGAYTGAYQNRLGLVEAANAGTLFLDEIAEVPLALQSKLLQFMETRVYRRLGSVQSKTFTGRLITATNRDLVKEVEAGRFRADLWYRLEVFMIHMPPLRDRREDIGDLVETLLEKLSIKHRRTKPIVQPEDLNILRSYDFPGNVRELRNLLERSLLLTAPESHWLELDRSWEKTKKIVINTPPPIPKRQLSPLEAQEYEVIEQALRQENGVIRRAASRLGMGHQSLLRRLEKWPELRELLPQKENE